MTDLILSVDATQLVINQSGEELVFDIDATLLTLGVALPAEATLGANVGGGTGEVFRDKTGITLNLKTLTGSGGVSITNNANTVDISTIGTSGDVTGPAGATDNAAARFDGVTGKLIQNSLVTIDDTGNVGLPALATVDGVDVSDHSARHDPGGADALTTAAPAQGVGGGNSEGVAASFSRSDHDHTIRETGGPTNLTVAVIADTHILTRSGTTVVGVPSSSIGAPLTSTAPVNVDTAAAVVGVSTEAARADHKHDIDTANGTISTIEAGDSAAEGTGLGLARRDHQHAVSTAAPSVGIGGANSEGAATTLARSDHNHTLRETGGPTNLTIAAIPDTQLLKRSGSTVVGIAPASALPLAASRTLFQEDPITGDIDPMFFTPVAIVLAEMRAIIRGGTSPSVAWTIRFDSDRSAAGTEVVTSGSTSTSKTTGHVITSFNNGTIPANSFVWLVLGTVSSGADAPLSFAVTLS